MLLAERKSQMDSKKCIDDEFDFEDPTQPIPKETMAEVSQRWQAERAQTEELLNDVNHYDDGLQPYGFDRPTRNIRPIK